MDGRFAVELGGDRLLDEIFAFDDPAQDRLDDVVGALVGRHVGQTQLVVQLLLRDVVRTDMRDHLSDDGGRLLLLAASGERDRARQRPEPSRRPATVLS